jgi:hypothetical protein
MPYNPIVLDALNSVVTTSLNSVVTTSLYDITKEVSIPLYGSAGIFLISAIVGIILIFQVCKFDAEKKLKA